MADKALMELIEKAACAHTDLNIFDVIIKMVEGSTLSPDSYVAAQRIVTICQTAQTKSLRQYDAACAKIARTQPEKRG